MGFQETRNKEFRAGVSFFVPKEILWGVTDLARTLDLIHEEAFASREIIEETLSSAIELCSQIETAKNKDCHRFVIGKGVKIIDKLPRDRAQQVREGVLEFRMAENERESSRMLSIPHKLEVKLNRFEDLLMRHLTIEQLRGGVNNWGTILTDLTLATALDYTYSFTLALLEAMEQGLISSYDGFYAHYLNGKKKKIIIPKSIRNAMRRARLKVLSNQPPNQV